MLRTEASPGRPFMMGFHVVPKSVVRRMYGAKSPDRWRSKDTYAVPRATADATTRPTYEPLAGAEMFLLTSVHVRPASVVTCTLPSSVPTQSSRGSRGDSETVVISLKLDSPSLRDRRM